MKLLSVVAIALVVVQLLYVAAMHSNSFDVIKGCRQSETAESYDSILTYFPTSSLLHAGSTAYSKYFKIAILGPNDGIIRYGESLFPYDKDVIEIVLGGTANTKSEGRVQHRTASNNANNTLLEIIHTPKLLSAFRPTMFVLEVFNNGTVQVSHDGHGHPFLSFNDSKRIPANYMAFTIWHKDVIFFYDCPLESTSTLPSTLLANCTVVS